MLDKILGASPSATLGVIAFVAVSALVWVIQARKNGNGNGNGHDKDDRDRIVRSVAYIEEHGIEPPSNWRDLPFTVRQLEAIDQRILHKRRSDAMQFGILATLLRRGHVNEAADLLEALERDAKQVVSRHGGTS